MVRVMFGSSLGWPSTIRLAAGSFVLVVLTLEPGAALAGVEGEVGAVGDEDRPDRGLLAAGLLAAELPGGDVDLPAGAWLVFRP
jgi:hypothetical protein